MNINNIIVHSLIKLQHESETSIDYSDDVMPIDNRVEAMLDSVRDVYNKKTGKAFATLGDDRFFSRELTRMYSDETNFKDFSVIAINELKSRVSAQPLATGGYVVFADFNSNGTHYFMIMMLKSKDGLSFDEHLKLTDAKQLDLEKLHFAARINVDAWLSNNEESGNYVSFIKGRSSASVTLYFKEYLGIEDFSESVKTTQDLLNAVSNYTRTVLELGNDEIEQYKVKVHDYCKEKHESETPIYLDELSRYLDEEEPAKFLEYAQENHQIPNEFQVDKAKLRRFLKYSGKDKDVSISFSASAYGTRVIYNENNNSLTINDVPNSLKQQLSFQHDQEQ